MAETREKQGRLRGRWLILIGILAVGSIIYFVLPPPRLVKEQRPKPSTQSFKLNKEIEKRKSKILQSSWIKFFPHLQHMVSSIDEADLNATISAVSATLTISQQPERGYRVGGVCKGEIISYDNGGNRKRYGGDFFIAALRRPSSKTDGVSCEVVDNMDGSYSVTCILPWEGRAEVNVIMLNPSEIIFQMIEKYSSEKEFGVYMNTTMLNSKKHIEYSQCSIGFPDKPSEELCNYSNPTHGEKRMCVKPASGECSTILWQEKQFLPELNFWDEVFLRENINYRVQINGSGAIIKVDRGNQSAKNYNLYKSLSMNPSSPSGWFLETKWSSLRVHAKRHVTTTLESCFKDKRVYFFGDSTMRQWYTYSLSRLRLKDHGPDNSVAWSQGRDAESKILNLTLQYRSHGPPLHNPGPEESRPYISDSLDLIREGGSGTFVFITVGFHFDYYDPEVFGARIKIIKKAAMSLLKRLPGAKVFIKGLHNHAYHRLCPSAWLNFRYDVMLRHEFRDVEGIIFIELWDLTVAAQNEFLHPKEALLHHIMELVLSHIC